MPVTGDEGTRARRSPCERSTPPPAQRMARRSHTLLLVGAAENKQLMQRVFAEARERQRPTVHGRTGE